MSETSVFTSAELLTDPQLVAQQQVAVADGWAAIYRDPKQEEPPQSAEIAIRNPAVYVEDISLLQLPVYLQARWQALLDRAGYLAELASAGKSDAGSDLNNLARLQEQIFTRDISPDFRGSVADVMCVASRLFAESSRYQPGNTRYYAGNVRGAKSWLQRIWDRRD